MTIRDLKQRDHRRAIDFAVRGMNFDRYAKSRFLQRLYGRYFLYTELNRATEVIAAYDGNRLAGLLIAVLYGQPRRHQTRFQRFFVSLLNALWRLYDDGVDVYEQTNRALLSRYRENFWPDGEILFLAANPDRLGDGIGTRLLDELQRRAAGKELYLFTDSNCTWQFYKHRGFSLGAESPISMALPDGPVTMVCYLYHKKFD